MGLQTLQRKCGRGEVRQEVGSQGGVFDGYPSPVRRRMTKC